MTEYEILDLFFEAMDDTYPLDLYEPRDGLPAYMYIEVNGECWRVLAQRHEHV